MKIRTITFGCEIKPSGIEQQVKQLGEKAHIARKWFVDHGYTVQTVRLSTQPWESYATNQKELISIAKTLQRISTKHGFDYFNMGPTKNPSFISFLPEVLKATQTGFCTSNMLDNNTMDHDATWETAKAIKTISKLEKQGFANLRFAALCNIQPCTPFYPASFHQGPASFGIGLENSDVVYNAFQKAADIKQASELLTDHLLDPYQKIEKICEELSEHINVSYTGIDTSVCSSIHKKQSTAFAFELLGLGRFGEPGTLAIAKIITDVLKHLPIKKIGYNGLMLPILEDHGLAERNNQGSYNLSNILHYSAVCGTGLDTIPLPGSIPVKKLYSILLDVASLSTKLEKPLSARLLPVPSKNSGEMTCFDFEYFVNSKIMNP